VSATGVAGRGCRATAACGSVTAVASIRIARPGDLAAAADLLAGSLGFTARDAVPAWFMRTTDECGGLTLVATAGDTVIGVSYALPGRGPDGAFLLSCGLAVAPEHRGRRLGRELKLAQRRRATALGYRSIHWTADPVNGRALRLYLSGLGAHLTGYRAGLHDGLRADPGHSQDDVEIVWHLAGSPPLQKREVRHVELPWSASQRGRVRREMSALLDDGHVGFAVELDREARRCRVCFARRSR
jgi:predicted GNAT superfamily acetyltransferase